MTYQTDSFSFHSVETAPARQTISTTYTELTGSKVQIDVRQGSSVYYRYSCYVSTIYDFATGATGSYEKFLLHFKVQKSNDNFSSNIVDIDSTKHNLSGDTLEDRDYYYISHSPMFIIDDVHDYTHLRLVARSYSTSQRADLHRARQFDGVDDDEVYYDASLICLEVR